MIKTVVYQYDKDLLKLGAGLSDVDNIKPSRNFYIAVENSHSYQELEAKLQEGYIKNAPTESEKECDMIAMRIATLLSEPTFSFRPSFLKSIHKHLFLDILRGDLAHYIGVYREHNITKSESIINGHTVFYSDKDEIQDALAYDFQEFGFESLSKLDKERLSIKVSDFVSRIWQVHPFREGNTRTITVFTIKLLNRLGVEANNDIFYENAKYFRNALVLANFSKREDRTLIVQQDKTYLYAFFHKLIVDKNTPLPEINNPFLST